jgi:N-acetylglucosaminyldiphosphoundecaprenol N-acetyl-beta-D-mannosaminyltransferase
MAGHDPDFRESVLDCQLSLVDGMPLVWQGRRAGIPFSERVAGSSLLERLAAERRAAPIKVFFGGEPGVSEKAARQISTFGPGLVAVGSFFPGFGSIDTMSTERSLRISIARP